MKNSDVEALLNKLPLHGGDLVSASEIYGIAVEDWIDLSTAMNPEPYPIPEIPAKAFNDLPYFQMDFIAAAQSYYGDIEFLPVAGAQAAIQAIPKVIDTLNNQQQYPVLLPAIGYKEHQRQWCKNGQLMQTYRSDSIDSMLADLTQQLQENPQQHIVIINPNNPSGVLFDKQQLLSLSASLAEGAYLIVDEAFVDVCPENSLLSEKQLPKNVIVLRSFGKFFGLAGIRLGFVFAAPEVLDPLQAQIGIWQVNGPAQFIASQALLDVKWQQQAIHNIKSNMALTEDVFQPLMQHYCMSSPVKHALFVAYFMSLESALFLYDQLAKVGILTRVIILDEPPYENKALLRVGNLSTFEQTINNKVSAVVRSLMQSHD